MWGAGCLPTLLILFLKRKRKNIFWVGDFFFRNDHSLEGWGSLPLLINIPEKETSLKGGMWDLKLQTDTQRDILLLLCWIVVKFTIFYNKNHAPFQLIFITFFKSGLYFFYIFYINWKFIKIYSRPYFMKIKHSSSPMQKYKW